MLCSEDLDYLKEEVKINKFFFFGFAMDKCIKKTKTINDIYTKHKIKNIEKELNRQLKQLCLRQLLNLNEEKKEIKSFFFS